MAAKQPRRRAREFVLQGLYQHLVGGQDQAAIEGHAAGVTNFDKADQTLYRALLGQTLDHAASLQAALAQAQAAVSGRGRAFLRPSGTEPVVRVTVEADDDALMQTTLDGLATAVRAAAT